MVCKSTFEMQMRVDLQWMLQSIYSQQSYQGPDQSVLAPASELPVLKFEEGLLLVKEGNIYGILPLSHCNGSRQAIAQMCYHCHVWRTVLYSAYTLEFYENADIIPLVMDMECQLCGYQCVSHTSRSMEEETIRGVEGVNYEFIFSEDKLFFHGKIWLDNGDERKVSFIPFKAGDTMTYEDQGRATDIIFQQSLKINHSGFLKPLLKTSCPEKKMHLLCYERFDAFLTEDWFKNHPRGWLDSRGDPLPWVQKCIRDTLETIKYILEQKVFHLKLGDFKSYVIVNNSIKIINVTESWVFFANAERLEAGEDIETLVRLSTVKPFILKDIRGSKKVWEKMLATEEDWEERDRFLKCFDLTINPWNLLLDKIINYPFLQTPEQRIRSFSQIHRAYMTDSLPRQQVFSQAIYSPIFNPYLNTLDPSSPRRVNLSRSLSEVASYDGKVYSGDAESLLRFLRAAYEHRKSDFTVEDMDMEIRTHWNGLLELFHEHS